jgi:hypothetical protein
MADYGEMMTQSSALAAYARAGAEYARGELLSGNAAPQASTIKQNLNIPTSVTVTFDPLSTSNIYCTCADGTKPAPLPACPGQNQVSPCLGKTDTRVLQYVAITLTQSPTPWLAYAALPSSTSAWALSNTMVVRVQ